MFTRPHALDFRQKQYETAARIQKILTLPKCSEADSRTVQKILREVASNDILTEKQQRNIQSIYFKYFKK